MPVRVAEDLVKTKTIVLGDGPEATEVVVKYADNRAIVQRRNFSDKVRYINEDETGRTTTERSFPMGDLMVSTILLVAVSWNVFPKEGAPAYPINERNLLTLLTADEFEQLYREIIDMNPAWGGQTSEGN